MNEYIGTREVAELLGVPEATVRYWRHINYGPPSARFGRTVKYSKAAVLAWAAAQFKAQSQ